MNPVQQLKHRSRFGVRQTVAFQPRQRHNRGMFGIAHREAIILLVLGLMAFGTLAVFVIAIVTSRRPVESGDLTPCPGCGRPVSKIAAICPQCGRPLS
jgi:hypothetical protein